MFEDGLHNRVDIYFLKEYGFGRTDKGRFKVSDIPDMENVPCRIIKDQKALFKEKVMLYDGYVLKDIDSGIVYEIQSGNRVRGIGITHHSSYKVRVKAESGKYG